MGILSWTIVGIAAGWITDHINKPPRYHIRWERIVAGIAGGLTGGLLSNVFFPPGGIHIDFAWQSTISSLVCATIIILIFTSIEKRKRV